VFAGALVLLVVLVVVVFVVVVLVVLFAFAGAVDEHAALAKSPPTKTASSILVLIYWGTSLPLS
jgi:hypothetical protein